MWMLIFIFLWVFLEGKFGLIVNYRRSGYGFGFWLLYMCVFEGCVYSC